MAKTSTTDWIGVDWGTSNLRAWAMSRRDGIIGYAGCENGMGKLAPKDFEPALVELISNWLPHGRKTPVIACGMVGARQGWLEAPYIKTPCSPVAKKLIAAPVRHPLLAVYVVPGISQQNPADVMRGEETQIAGFLSVNPDWDGVICLPGTHSKWVRISAGKIVDFTTFISGELFSLLSLKSVLRHDVATKGWNEEAFAAALYDILKSPELITAQLFSIRARSLIEGLSPQSARARLSGLLIGLELAGARLYWQKSKLALIGAEKLCALYAKALETQGVMASIYDDRHMSLAGLNTAYTLLKESK